MKPKNRDLCINFQVPTNGASYSNVALPFAGAAHRGLFFKQWTTAMKKNIRATQTGVKNDV